MTLSWNVWWQETLPMTRGVHTSFRAREVLPRLPPAGQALLRSQAGPHAGAWLTAIPSEEGATLTPNLMHIALRRRLRLPLPPAAQRCGQGARRHGCGGALDPLGDHALACPRSGLLARRAHVLEHAWIRVAREAVGSEGRVVPQPWLAHTNLATAVDDRRWLDLLIHGATPRGEALACDVTLVSPLTRSGQPTRQAATHDGAALLAARARKHRRYPELLGGAPSAFWYLARRSAGGGIRNACNLCACWSLSAAHARRRHSGRQRHRVGSDGGGAFSVLPSKRLCAPQHSGLSGSPHRSPTQAHQAWPASLTRFRWMVQAAFRFRFTPRRSCVAHTC